MPPPATDIRQLRGYLEQKAATRLRDPGCQPPGLEEGVLRRSRHDPAILRAGWPRPRSSRILTRWYCPRRGPGLVHDRCGDRNLRHCAAKVPSRCAEAPTRVTTRRGVRAPIAGVFIPSMNA